jgi:PilZ domain-containing protein
MPKMSADRRAAPRYPIILVAEVTEIPSGTILDARTSDMSRTGCYIDTLNPIPAGTPIRLKLSGESEIFETAGKVVYVSAGLGMGVAFVGPPAANQLAILDRWLDEAAQAQT